MASTATVPAGPVELPRSRQEADERESAGMSRNEPGISRRHGGEDCTAGQKGRWPPGPGGGTDPKPRHPGPDSSRPKETKGGEAGSG